MEYVDRQIHLLQQDGLGIVFADPDIENVLTGFLIWQAKALPSKAVETRYLIAEKRYVLCVSVELIGSRTRFLNSDLAVSWQIRARVCLSSSNLQRLRNSQ